MNSHEAVPASDPAVEAIMVLAGTIVQNDGYVDKPWTGITLIATAGWQEPFYVKEIFGYCYYGRDHSPAWRAELPTPLDDTEAAIISLAQVMAERDETAPWNHCMIQIDRATESFDGSYDYSDQCPWRPDFSRLDDWVEDLRPGSP